MVTTIFILAFVLLAYFPATQYLRDVVDARRVRNGGIGGTGDIAIWAMIGQLFLVVGTAVFFYFAASSLRERLGR